MLSELEKQAKVGRQAMNIQIMELMFQSADSDGRPIDEPGYMKMALYNLETISAEEVEEIMKAGTYDQDPRIIMVWPDEITNVFPHRGESKNSVPASYWKRDQQQPLYCSCSACGLKVRVVDALEWSPHGYTGIKYRFCPRCGSVMEHEPEKEES